jgi:hypothetical protein
VIHLAQARGGSDLTFYVVGFLLLLFLVLIIFLFRFINLWIQAYLSKAPVSLGAHCREPCGPRSRLPSRRGDRSRGP